MFAIHAYSQSNSAVSEFDPEFGLYLDISRNFRLVFYTGSEKTEQTGSYKGKIGGGASFRMRPVFTLIDDDPDSDKRHRLVIGTFYEFSRSTESAGTTTENRVIVEATPRLHFGHKILLTDRNRTEFRWLGREFRFRYRNRLRLERRFRIGKFRANPYGQAEVYRDFHFDRWSIMKFGVGAEVPVRRWSSFDIFYERQHCVVCESPHANILGLTFNLFLKLKQK
ncbi:MAG: hypothetical protein ACJ72Z_11645 [Pyrinomonadaceae bacterium]